MKEPRVNVSINMPLSMYQWLGRSADKSERTISKEILAQLLPIFLKECTDERRNDHRPAANR
jgi:hypothetical protein